MPIVYIIFTSLWNRVIFTHSHAKQTDATFFVHIKKTDSPLPHPSQATRMNLNKFHGVYFRGTACPSPQRKCSPSPTLSGLCFTHLNLKMLPAPRPLRYLPATVITHLQTFGPRLLYAWACFGGERERVSERKWGGSFVFCIGLQNEQQQRRMNERKSAKSYKSFQWI